MLGQGGRGGRGFGHIWKMKWYFTSPLIGGDVGRGPVGGGPGIFFSHLLYHPFLSFSFFDGEGAHCPFDVTTPLSE